MLGGARRTVNAKFVEPALPSGNATSLIVNAGSTIEVVAIAVLFAGNASASPRETVARLVSTLPLTGTTMIVMVAWAPAGKVPRLHVTRLPERLQGASVDATADTNETPAGSVLVTRTSVAGSGPVLPMLNVYVSVEPSVIGSGESTMVIDTSLLRPTSNGLLEPK